MLRFVPDQWDNFVERVERGFDVVVGGVDVARYPQHLAVAEGINERLGAVMTGTAHDAVGVAEYPGQVGQIRAAINGHAEDSAAAARSWPDHGQVFALLRLRPH